MNNITAIRTLAAIVVVVVLIFTAGSLVPTTTTSTLPAVFAYQNKGVRDNGNGNGNNTVTAQITKQNGKVSGYNNTQEQEAQNLICTHPGNNETCLQERIISTTPQISQPVLSPTPPQPSATLTITKHIINDNGGTSTAKDFPHAVAADHNKCSRDIITCTQKETHNSTKDTIPFVLPIPFP